MSGSIVGGVAILQPMHAAGWLFRRAETGFPRSFDRLQMQDVKETVACRYMNWWCGLCRFGVRECLLAVLCSAGDPAALIQAVLGSVAS